MSKDIHAAVTAIMAADAARPSGPTSEIYMQVFGKLVSSLPHCPARDIMLDALYVATTNICKNAEDSNAHKGTVAYAKALEAAMELRLNSHIGTIKSICRRQKKFLDNLGVIQSEAEALVRDLSNYQHTSDADSDRI